MVQHQECIRALHLTAVSSRPLTSQSLGLSAFCLPPYWQRWQERPAFWVVNVQVGLNCCDVPNTLLPWQQGNVRPPFSYVSAQQIICPACLFCLEEKFAKFQKYDRFSGQSILFENQFNKLGFYLGFPGTSGSVKPGEQQHLIHLRAQFSLEHIGILWRHAPTPRLHPKPLTSASLEVKGTNKFNTLQGMLEITNLER